MTIPNVYMTWCQRKAICKWCEFAIEAGTPMVTVFFWHKGDEDHRQWNKKLYYHPQCWVGQGLDYLKMNPYVPYVRKPKAKLSEEQRKQRAALLNRKCSLEQRRRNVKSGYPDRLLVEARLDRQIAELMMEMIPVGGIPKRWLEQLT